MSCRIDSRANIGSSYSNKPWAARLQRSRFSKKTAPVKAAHFYRTFFVSPDQSNVSNVHTLDAALTALGWDEVDLLKIDAEGYDLQVMRGAESLIKSRRIGVIQFEYNRAWQLVGDTLRGAYLLLEEAGYKIFVLKRDGLFTLDYKLYEEYFEYTNFVAVAPGRMSQFKERVRGLI
ncbi:MAG TPA: FkbM family methyltransferase [Candidatus Acidoferrales bacterium]|nr:FkbM family methyltransferase [Candidatus Acidoferrales bacterium]